MPNDRFIAREDDVLDLETGIRYSTADDAEAVADLLNSTPPNTEGLTAADVELLRSLPVGPYDVLAERDKVNRHARLIDAGFCRRIYAGRRDGILLQTVGRTPLADQLLATLDQALDTERERVLAEIDAAARHLVEFEVWAGSGGFSLRLHCHTLTSEDGDEIDPEGDSLLDAMTYATDALTTPQESNQEGAG